MTLTDSRTLTRDMHEAIELYAQGLALLRPLWSGRPDQPRYVAKRLAIRLLEYASTRGDILVGLTLARANHTTTAEHSLRVGILMAHVVSYLSLPRRQQLDAVMCALLHHLGHDTHGAYAQSRDAMAQRSLVTLLLSREPGPGLYRQVLVAFQHELGYDGTGFPRLDFPVRQHPLSYLLTAVNDFAELTSGKTAVQGSREAMPAGQVLRMMFAARERRYAPHVLNVLGRLVAPVQVGNLVELDDGARAVVTRYWPGDATWEADLITLSTPHARLRISSSSKPGLKAVLDTLPMWSKVRS